MTKEFLLSCVHGRDIFNDDCIAGHYDVDEIASRASNIVKYGFIALKLDQVVIKRKAAHCVRTTPHAVVLRGLNKLIRQTAKIRPSDRNTIVRRLTTVLQEGVPHRVYKLDIKAFFESVNVESIMEQIANLSPMPRSAIFALSNYFSELKQRGIVGLPRGVPLSATLSEFALQHFDRELSLLPEIYFHARFVDDIVIVTSARENPRQFVRNIKCLLRPIGLELNYQKTKTIEIPVQRKSDGQRIVGHFDYLGYTFSIHESTRDSQDRFYRNVRVTIAKAKIARLKTRLCRSIAAFLSDGDIGSLERRLQLLTGNYNVRDFAKNRSRNAGLYCNYRQVNSFEALKELDAFLRSVLLGNRSRLSRRLSAKIPIEVRRSLLKFNFERSFRQRTYYSFSASELTDLRRCWRDG